MWVVQKWNCLWSWELQSSAFLCCGSVDYNICSPSIVASDSYCPLIDLYSVTLKCYWAYILDQMWNLSDHQLEEWCANGLAQKDNHMQGTSYLSKLWVCTEILESWVLSPMGIKRSQCDSRLLQSQDADTIDLFLLPKGWATLTWGY